MGSLEKDLLKNREEDLKLLEAAKQLCKTQVEGSSLVVSCTQRLTTRLTLWPEQRVKLKRLLNPVEVSKKKVNSFEDHHDIQPYDEYKDSYD